MRSWSRSTAEERLLPPGPTSSSTGWRHRRPPRRPSSGSRRSSRNIRLRRAKRRRAHGHSNAAHAASRLIGARRGRRTGAALYRQRGCHYRRGVVEPGLRAGGGRRVQSDGRRLRKGERQHDRLHDRAERAAATEGGVGDHQRHRSGCHGGRRLPVCPAQRLGRQAPRHQRRDRATEIAIQPDCRVFLPSLQQTLRNSAAITWRQ